MSAVTATQQFANVVQLPLQGAGLPELVESACHDCGHAILDEMPRIFCENCIALDDLARARELARARTTA